MSSNQVLEVKIESLHRELNSFKEETKEDIRDINISIKQSEKLFNAAMTMTENITKLTTIAGQQREEMRQQREESTYPNNCTIGIECNHIDMSGKMTFETYQSLLEFCVPLLKRYNLTENDLRLHKEVVGWKDCHRWFVNNPDEWALFKEKVGKALHGDTPKNTTTITKEKVVYIMSKYFKDIPEKMKWVSDPADRLYEKGIVLGDEKGNLHPDKPATRAEVISFIDRAVEYVLKEVK